METIRLSSSLFTLSTTRTLRFLGLTARSKIKTTTIPRSGHISVVRSLSSDSTGGTVSARPSSKLKKKNKDPDEEVEDAKLQALRETFFRPAVGIDAYIIPSEDAHQSEFIAERFMRRAYVSGFTGSAGTAVVTKKSAYLWTDGRYFLQAEKQLGKGWGLMRSGTAGVPTTAEWLNQALDPGCRVGIDPFLFSSDAAEELKNVISQKNHELVYLYDVNLVDEIWKESQPKPPSEPIRVHPIEYAGVDVSSKLFSLRTELANAGCTAIVISMLDEIAWLLNLRGNDIPNSPVFYAYLIVNNNGAKLFVDTCKVTPEVMLHLKSAGVKLQPYESIISEIESLSVKGERLWMDKLSVNSAIANAFKSASEKHHLDMQYAALCRASPITMSKAIKNHAELVGMCNSHLRDAAALAYFWAWLEDQIHNNVEITEVDVADRLLEFRSKQSGFVDTSFDTISGYGANGAIIHYRPYPESCSIVDDKNLFLLDSGAQYVDGTTDITRTVHFGEPTKRQKECFTRVLQGHIALDMAVFPENMPGFVLDVLARSSLWKIGLDYRHGTGHGVGAALNVHEGPHSISFRFGNLTPLQEGMIVSNEPGYYEDHSFGIRIENLVYIKEASTPNRYGGMKYLGFEKLTFVPIQTKLIDLSLLSTTEIAWLDDYHSQVWEKVSPKSRFVNRIVSSMFNTVSGKKIAVLGFAFKKDTGDTRETPAIDVCKGLIGDRAQINIYDPQVTEDQIQRDLAMNKFDWDHPLHLQPMSPTAVKQVRVVWDAYEATKDAHGVCILTEWDEFKKLDFQKIYDNMQKPAFVFDGRNVVDAEKLREIGFIVYMIGKPLDAWLKDMPAMV